METRKVLVVDDEAIARSRICRFLREIKPTFQIREADHGMAAIQEIPVFCPDIVFLDIQMPGLGGFEVLQQFERVSFQVIFQTAFDEFAVRAFEASACDYLLKPFSKERLQKSIEKAMLRIDQAELFENLNGQLLKSAHYLKKLTYKNGGTLRILPIEEIQYFLSQDHCTCAYDFSGQEHIVEVSIGHLEKQLDPEQFIRCHRNNIVRIQDINAVGSLAESTVTLKSGQVLPLSRPQRAKVLASLC